MRIYWLSASLNPTTRYIPLAYRTRAGESRAVREARSCSLSLPAEEETELTCNLYAGSSSAHLRNCLLTPHYFVPPSSVFVNLIHLLLSYIVPMSARSNIRAPRPRSRRRRSRRFRFRSVFRFARRRRRELRLFLRALSKTHPIPRFLISAVLLVVLFLGLNWLYHAFYKPTEALFPLEDALDKSPRETWREYGPLFLKHSTAIVTPELLAALAQAESGGNPVARTYWRWRFSWNPLDWYQPASSAVGMFQITDGAFEEAKHYCIHDHAVAEEGPWHDIRSCWFNNLYTRVLPSHAIELTAVLLDRQITRTIGNRRASFAQKHNLAAVIHLCGAGIGRDYVRRGFQLSPHQRCGDHDMRLYLVKINVLKQQFDRLATPRS